MEFKGTKGKWKIGNHFSNIVTDEKPARPSYSEEDFESEKKYYGGYLVTESVSRKADAQLIAAAPELLEALQDVRGILESPKLIDAGVLRRIVNSAIEKALGE